MTPRNGMRLKAKCKKLRAQPPKTFSLSLYALSLSNANPQIKF